MNYKFWSSSEILMQALEEFFCQEQYHIVVNDMNDTSEHWYTSKISSILVVFMIDKPYIVSGIN